MFRNQFVFPETDIFFLHSNEDCEKCGIELDSVGRPLRAQAVDQFDSQPFMMGENGFRRSDIAILMAAESDDLKRAVAARMEEIKSSFPDQTLSDFELADMAIPRHCQSGSLFRDWYSSLNHTGDAKQIDAYFESLKSKVEKSPDTITFEDSNSE